MGKRVLVVDDEQDILMVVESRLRANGYDVVTASDGIEALEKVAENIPALIVLDVVMPRADGFKVLESLKEKPATASIPVVMLTARGEAKHIAKAQEMEVSDYLTKPFKDEDLVSMVEKYI